MAKHKSSPHPVMELIQLLERGSYRAYSTTRGIKYERSAEMYVKDEPSGDPYAGFNVCHYSGDRPEHIAECRAELAETFGTDERHLIIPRQTHSTSIKCITDSLPSPEELEGVDGVVTTRRDIIIGVNTADCVPLILLDEEAGVMGAVHAGWRGAVAGIAAEAVRAMERLGAKAEKIAATMGPSICRECFEVGPEVAGQFPQSCVTTEGYSRPHVSLQECITEQLASLGVKAENIIPFDRSLCTCCNPSKYFSARALGVNSGRVFSFITALEKREDK